MITPATVKQELFRFVSYKAPKKNTSTDFENLLVKHPDFSASYWSKLPRGSVQDPKIVENIIAGFVPIRTLKDVETAYPSLYSFSDNLIARNPKIKDIVTDNITPLSQDQEIKLSDQVIFQVLTTSPDLMLRERMTQILLANRVVANKNVARLYPNKNVDNIKVVIPEQVIDIIKPTYFRNCDGNMHGVINLGIADFKKVEQEVCCYVPGEVSHIENVMAREYKERSSRNLIRSENTIEQSRESEMENLTDTTTTTRHELNTEVARVLDDMKTNNYGGSLGASASWGGVYNVNADFSANFSSSSASSLSNTESKQYAEEVTSRALERILQKTTERRTSKIIKEYEEQNKHGFDNRNGDKHVTGIYRWIDIVYKNNLVNYGKRLLVEFMVPEPAEFYKRMRNYKPKQTNVEQDNQPQAPRNLTSFGINSPNDINNDNVYVAASYYGLTVDTLPNATYETTKDLSPLMPVDHNRATDTQSLMPINIPSEYEADKITGSYTYEYRASSWYSSQQAFCDFTFGGNIVNSERDYSFNRETKSVSINLDLSPNLMGSVPVSVAYSGCFGFYGAITVKCVLKGSVLSEWKSSMYNKLLTAYNNKMDAYNRDLKESKKEEEVMATQDTYTNPAKNRITEQRELKRICIEMLMKPYCKVQGKKNFADTNACDLYQIPQVTQTAEYARYTEMVRFFEMAIDWKLMSYLFYPYYWADKCSWADLMLREDDDAVFQAFLQSGMARVVVPIRLSFSETFALYLETGNIAMGTSLASGASGGSYLSFIEELQTIEGTIEDTWETRVPTALAIIQGKSAFLDEEGLPCCHTDETNNFIPYDNTLKNIIPTNTNL